MLYIENNVKFLIASYVAAVPEYHNVTNVQPIILKLHHVFPRNDRRGPL